MPTFTGKFEYLIDGRKVTQEQFQQLVDGKENDYDISIDNLRVVADKKGNEPFFLDEFLFPAKIEKIWLTDNTGGTVFEKVQDSSISKCLKESEEFFSRLYSNQTKEQKEVLDVYNDIVGHSTRHKAGKEVKTEEKPKFRANFYNYTYGSPITQVKDFITLEQIEEYFNCSIYSEVFIYEYGTQELVDKWDKAKDKEKLDTLKKQLLNSGLFISLEDATLIFNAETEEELQPLIGRTNPLLGESPVFNLKESAEHIIESFGKKETEGKLHYELSWEFIEEMAKRMANNKSDKYPLYNWKKPLDIQSLKDAINRHHIEVMKGNYQDGDEILGHIVQYACNGMMLWEQLKNKQ